MAIQQDKNKLSQSNLSFVHELISKGEYKEALTGLDKLTQSHLKDPTLYLLGGNCYGAMGHLEQAILCYQEAIKLKPDFAEAHNNIGICLHDLGRPKEAHISYKRALSLKPDYADAHNNIGNIYKDLGQVDKAILSYQKAIEINPNSFGAFDNLGAIFSELGKIKEANAAYARARGHNKDFEQAMLLLEEKKFSEAIKFFESAQIADWEEKVLECFYRNKEFDKFKEKLSTILNKNKHVLRNIAALSSHYAQNFKVADPYNFCPSPLDFVCNEKIPELIENDQKLIKELIDDINTAEIQKRKYQYLFNGSSVEQSAGHIFKRPEKSFKKLQEALKIAIEKYFLQYEKEDNEFIRSFPKNINFITAWYVKMQSGGYLSSHIHEEGWISGAVYLSIPKDSGLDGQEGAIELSSDGDEYPRLHDEFEKKVILPDVGDVIFFPSSVFHRTIPFNSNEERICIAFDVKP